MSELLKLASFLDNVNRIKTYGKKEREDLPNDSLDAYFEGLTPMTQLANEIHRCILSEEEMADDASPRLKSIRRSKLSTNEKIHSQLCHRSKMCIRDRYYMSKKGDSPDCEWM